MDDKLKQKIEEIERKQKEDDTGFDPESFAIGGGKEVETKTDRPEPEGQEFEIDPDGFAESVGTLIGGFTGQGEKFVEQYTQITGTLLKLTGAQKLQSFEAAFANLPMIARMGIFVGILAAPAIGLMYINKKNKAEEEKAEVFEQNLKEEMLKTPPSKEPPISDRQIPGGIKKIKKTDEWPEEVDSEVSELEGIPDYTP